MKVLSFFLPVFVVLTSVLPATAQFKMQTPAGEAPGSWIFGTIGVGKSADNKPETTALKGLAVKVGVNGEAAVVYDLDLCRLAGAWTGGRFTTPMNLMSRGEYPLALGEVAFTAQEVAGFQIGDGKERLIWKDPRDEPFGPLPDTRFRGMYKNGAEIVLKWDLAGTEVLETPGYKQFEGVSCFTRTFLVQPTPNAISIPVFQTPEGAKQLEEDSSKRKESESGRTLVNLQSDKFLWNIAVLSSQEGQGSFLREFNGTLWCTIPPSTERRVYKLAIARGKRAAAEHSIPEQIGAPAFSSFDSIGDGPALWPETTTTQGEVSASTDEAYVVDTIKLPEKNPWNAPMFVGGFDFFADGRAAVSTFHGDVLIASGIDEKLDSIVWRRFASGLYHPLGLKIVEDDVYVTCRDGIYRLRDLNKDGEADFYEAFNYDLKVTKNFHEFVFDLHTDRDGNFYFAKAGPVKNGGRGFDEIMSHHGTLLRVSPDGKKLAVVATGFRAPNGIGVGPNTELTSGDNEGTWTPACKINWINQDGFYGVVDLAHRNPPPTDYDRPLCWLPKRVDNSGGSQVWVTSDRWGPWTGKMLHLSYGQSSLYGVLMEGVDVPNAPSCCSHVMQGGVVQFPLKFESGIMRARFHPKDGQLYVAGLRGWQTNGIKNGCFQRVRYTGAPAHMPIQMSAKKDGIEIRFTTSLDTQAAADPENWNVEVWNYIWSEAYGSPEVSTIQSEQDSVPGAPSSSTAHRAKKGHDPLTVKSVRIGTDDRTVFLEIPDLKPVMQMSIKYQIRSVDGEDIDGEIVNTIHALDAVH